MVGNNIVQVSNIVLHLPQRMVDVANAAFGPAERDPNGPVGLIGVGRMAGEISSINTIPIAERASALDQRGRIRQCRPAGVQPDPAHAA